MLIWYLPTFHGDIRLESKGDMITEVHLVQLTPTERAAVEALRARAINPPALRRAWAHTDAFPELGSSPYRDTHSMSVTLAAPIRDVQKFLAKRLKPGRTFMSVVRFSSGRMQEIHDVPGREEPPELVETVAEPPKPEIPKPAPKPKPAVAATVATPTRGCPTPEFEEAELRANRVLEAFLDPEQLEDFRRLNRFVTVGADSGHRYMVISRNRPQDFKRHGSRSLYDLDREVPCCVHDWTVPAAEEMLALHLFLSMPGRERYITTLPEG